MSDDIQVIDYSSSPAGSRNSPAPGRVTTNKSPGVSSSKLALAAGAQLQAAAEAKLAADTQSRYQALLTVIEELGRDIRPTYAGNKLAAERLKRGIVHARVLARDCMSESDRISRSGN